MSRPDGPPAAAEFGAGYWEHRYRSGEGVGTRPPSPTLVGPAAALPPGRALDAGCGNGGDALWLAARGWQVTAVDVSATALDLAGRAAAQAGPEVAGRVRWVHADLGAWDPGGRRFDLVTCHYVHAPGPARDLFARLASWVAPGGTLLVAGHGEALDRHAAAHPPGALLRAEDVTAVLRGQWEVAVDAGPPAGRQHGPGGGVGPDVVVRARRGEAAPP